MTRLKTLFAAGFAIFLLLSTAATATTYYSNASSTPQTLANWNSNRDGTSGSTPANFTTAGDLFIVQGTGGGSGAPHTMATGTGAGGLWTIGTSGNAVNMEIEGGATLQADTSVTISSTTATFTIDAGGTYIQNCNASYSSTILKGVESFATTSNFIIQKSATTGPANPTGGFGNLTINATSFSTGASVNCSGAVTIVNGNFTILSTGGGSLEWRMTGATALTLTIGGNLDIQGGVLNFGNSSSAPVFNLSGNFSMSGGTLSYTATTANLTATVNFSKSGTQTFTKSSGSIVALTANTRTIAFNVNSGSTLDMGANILDNGGTSTATFTVASGGGLKLGSTAGITSSGATGNVQVSGARTFSTGGNYTYNGSSAQVTGNGLPPTVNNLTVNNSSGVTLSNGVTVSGAITMTSGTLALGTNSLTIGSSGSISGANVSNYVVTDNSGVLTRIGVGASDIAFPVGTVSSYNPVTINNAGTSDDFSVNVKSSLDNAPTDASKIVNRQWTILEGTPGGSNATLTFQWNGSEEAGSFNRNGVLVIGHYGGSWDETSASLSGSDPYTATASGFASFSPFSVGNGGSLPVEITSFSANAHGTNVELSWATATELSNHGFEVQRTVISDQSSVNSSQIVNRKSKIENWAKVAFVEGAGTSNAPKSYTYHDVASSAGKYAYRLKQIDHDGSFKYSGQVEAQIVFTAEDYKLTQNYPNPFNPTTTLRFAVKSPQFVTLKVYNSIGQEVRTLFEQTADADVLYSIQFDGTGLSSGVYYYTLKTADRSEIKKMVMMK